VPLDRACCSLSDIADIDRLEPRPTATDQRQAQVAELVDALASGASDRKIVEVRVFSWAPLWA
jgi:hypothetical protein